MRQPQQLNTAARTYDRLAPAASLLTVMLVLTGCGVSGRSTSDRRRPSTTTTAPSDTQPGETSTTDAPTSPSTSEGGADAAVQEWAGKFCRSYGKWVHDTKDLVSSGRRDVQAAADPPTVKKRLLRLYDGASRLTGTLVDDIDRLGPPPSPRGPEVHRGILAGLRALRGRLVDLSAKVSAADPSDSATFQRAVADAGSDFQSRLGEVSTSFSDLDTKYPDRQLSRAMASACSGIVP